MFTVPDSLLTSNVNPSWISSPIKNIDIGFTKKINVSISKKYEDIKKVLTIRPDNIEFVDEVKDNCIKGKIEVKTYLGRGYQYIVNTEYGLLTVNDASNIYREDLSECILYLNPNKISLV